MYAFEPHAGNVTALLRNLAANGLERRLESGDGLGEVGGADRGGAHSELKATYSADRLVEQGVTRPPTLVKIDVEGDEQQVLQGMSGLLSGEGAPRSLQLELKAAARQEINAYLSDRGVSPRTQPSVLQGEAARRTRQGPRARQP